MTSHAEFSEDALADRAPLANPFKGQDEYGLPTVIVDGRAEVPLAEALRQRLEARRGANVSYIVREFRKVDAEGTGFVRAKEVQDFLVRRNIFLSDEQLASVVRAFDTDGNGALDYVEFARAVLPDKFNASPEALAAPTIRSGWVVRDAEAARLEAAGVPRLTVAGRYVTLAELVREKLAARTRHANGLARRAFKVLDTNKDGRVTASEIRRLLETFAVYLDDAQLAALMSEWDPNGDGISCDEFMHRVLPDSFAPPGLQDAGLPGM